MSSVDSPQCQYQVGDRVLFHNKQGKPHYGSVEWTGRKEGVPYNIVGIKTVSILNIAVHANIEVF